MILSSFACWSRHLPLLHLIERAALRSGTYKIPTANDIPVDMRVELLRDAPCVKTPLAHSSKAIGEPPFFLGAAVFFALKVGEKKKACVCEASSGVFAEPLHASIWLAALL